ncbi:MAG TPA: PLP-dependent cysteine synthase family protein [Conexivisphaerales archaeon]|nr:PLP-dependent cysteine synthase family protein [Conexivisphaerales archaeon]
MIYDSVLDLVGNTPMVRVHSLAANDAVELYIKLEKMNPGGSVKDRIAKYMIEDAERSGTLVPGKIVIEPTSGNTGIGLAMVCRSKGYDCVLVMPETMTMERRQILIALGAKIILTPGTGGMDGAEDYARSLVTRNPGKYFMPDQFGNEVNALAHYETTAEEIWKDTKGRVDLVVAGLGTSGTSMGIARRLKELNPKVRVIGVAPDEKTPIQGLKNYNIQHVPGIWRPELVDEVRYVSSKTAEETVRLLALAEGLLVGPSSGAVLHVALKEANSMEGGVVVSMAPDGLERYLTTPVCEPSYCLECAQKYGIRCSYSDGVPIAKSQE